jgi:DNA-binding CsgD family transcriptional regulator
MDLEWPFMGRAAELERIARVREDGGYPGVVIAAGPGVGKSGLAREAVVVAESGGAFVAWVQATRSAASVPLAAFASLLPGDVGSDDPLELMQRGAATLRERAADRPIVLGVDDAQLLDPTSAALVLHLAVTGTAFVIVTVRSDEPCEDAIMALWKDGGAVRLELGPLDEAATSELIEAALGGPLEQGAFQWMFGRSTGNPLYVRELVLGALESGSLTRTGGLWELLRKPPVSATLGDLISSRMSGLDKVERQAIEMVAFGEPIPLRLAVELTGSDALAAAENQRMVVVDNPSSGGAVRLAHPIYGEVVRASLPAAWARELRVRLAEVVQAQGDLGSDDALRVARWLLDAGEPMSVALLVTAANAALWAGDPELGSELAGLAIDAGGGFDAALLLARAHARLKRFDKAAVVLVGAEALIEDQESAVAYLEQCISVQFWGLRRPEELGALLERAEGWWPDEVWQQRLAPLRMHATSMNGLFGGTVDESERLLAEPDLDPSVRRQLEPLHAAHLFYDGRTEEAYRLARRIRPSVPFTRQSDERALGLWSKIALESGREWDEVEAWMAAAVNEAVKVGDNAAGGLAALTLGRLCSMKGRFGLALNWVAEAEYCFAQQDTFGGLSTACAVAVVVAACTGDVPRALAALERCHAALGHQPAMPNQLPYVVRAEGWADWTRGDKQRGQARLLDGATAMRSKPVYSALLAYEAMRAGARPGELVESLTQSAARCDAPLVKLYATHAIALAAEDGRGAFAASDAFERIGALRYAMEAAAHAAGIFARAGQEDAARRAATQSLDLHARGDGGLPPVLGDLAGGVVLTPREEELVGLARRGLSNTEIADRLVLSVRTVESHIYRAMQKLGVNDRHDL